MKPQSIRILWLAFAILGAMFVAQATPAQDKDKKIQYWVTELQKKNAKAVDALIKAGPDAAPFVAPLISDTDAWTRKKACTILGFMGPGARGSLTHLTNGLRHEERDTRLAVLACLASLGFHAKETSGEVIPMVNDADFNVRRFAWNALREISMDERLLPLARKVPVEDGREVRLAAAWIIWRLDPKAKGREVLGPVLEIASRPGNADQEAFTIIETLAPDYPEMVDDIAKLHASSYSRTRIVQILATMGKEGRSRSRQLIEQFLAEGKDPQGRLAVMSVLAAHDLDEALLIKHLIADLDRKGNTDPTTLMNLLRRVGPKAKDAAPKLEGIKKNRMYVLRTILAVDPARGPKLRAELEEEANKKDKLGRVNYDAQILLYQIDKKEEHLAAIKKVLQDKTSPERGVVARKAAQLGADGAILLPDLEKVMAEATPQARVSACVAIWAIEKNANKVVPALIKTLDAESQFANESLTVFRSLGPAGKAGVAALTKLAKTTGNANQRRLAIEVILQIDRPAGLGLMKKWD